MENQFENQVPQVENQPPQVQQIFCAFCGKPLGADYRVCPACGRACLHNPAPSPVYQQPAYQPPVQQPVYQQPPYPQQQYQQQAYQQQYQQPMHPEQKSKLMAGLLGIFLGGLGIHNFYLGYNTKGAIQLALTVVGYILCVVVIGLIPVIAVGIWALVEAIQILAGTITADAKGVPLKD